MMHYRKTTLLWLLLLSLMLVACGGDSDDEGDSGGDSDTTSQSDAGSEENQEEEESSGAASSGGQTAETTIEVEGGTVTLTLPGGWAIDDSGDEVVVANSDAALGVEDPAALEAGQVRGTVFFIGNETERATELGLRRSSPALNVSRDLIAELEGGEITYAFGAPLPFIISGKQAALTDGTATVGETEVDANLAVYNEGGGFGYVIAFAPLEEIDRYNGTLRNLVGSMVFEAAESGE